MKMAPICPRCGGPLTEPSPWASAWRCALHGEVYPLRSPYSPSGDGLRGLLRLARVPVWVPWPLPAGWLVTGFAGAGDDRTGTRACVVALSGANPVGGPGEMLGKRQSGMEEFRIADVNAHANLLAVAHDDARLILSRDPDLRSPRGDALRTLLYLFGRDEAVRYLRTG
jgi:hypothetical protein